MVSTPAEYWHVSTRALVAPNTDPTNINMTIPDKATRLGKYLRFNDTTGNPEAGDTAGAFYRCWHESL
jgi:hypothetical protein